MSVRVLSVFVGAEFLVVIVLGALIATGTDDGFLALHTRGRHTVALYRKPSTGQAALLPVQLSAASHTSTAARHTVLIVP